MKIRMVFVVIARTAKGWRSAVYETFPGGESYRATSSFDSREECIADLENVL